MEMSKYTWLGQYFEKAEDRIDFGRCFWQEDDQTGWFVSSTTSWGMFVPEFG